MIKLLRNVGSFLAGGAIAQAIGAVSGILLVRWMSIADYAVYTVAMTMVGAIFLLTKGGPHMGLSAVLSKVWPDRIQSAKAVASLINTRLLISVVIMPPLLGFSAYLLNGAGAEVWVIVLVVGLLALIWVADMYSGIVDQVLFFDGKAVRVQLADTLLAAGRLALILGLRLFGWLSVVAAVATSLFIVAARILPIRKWVDEALDRARAAPDPAMAAEIKAIAVRQMPVDVFVLLHSQATIFYLTMETANAFELATFGALARINQLLTPFSGLILAYFVPSFSKSNDRVMQRIGLFVLLGSLPSVALLAWAFAAPQSILWVLGSAYETQTYPLLVYTVALVFMTAVNLAWTLVSYRGWNRWAWVRIPLGVAWIAIAPWLLPVDTAAGAYIFVAGFSVGMLVSLGFDLWHSRQQGEIRLLARDEPEQSIAGTQEQ